MWQMELQKELGYLILVESYNQSFLQILHLKHLMDKSAHPCKPHPVKQVNQLEDHYHEQ